MAHSVDAAIDEALLARVWRASEGHPLMAVETMRTLEQGVAPTERSAVALPERVRDLIAARLERLGERARGVVAVAAVIGRAFEFALLERAVGAGDVAAAEAVEELVRRRVLHGTGTRFEFTHERVREVVYRGLLVPRQRVLHRQVAEALEAVYAMDLAPHQAALGAHFQVAGVWDKAVRYLRGAGEWALARAAHREAATCFEQAIAAAWELPRDARSAGLAIDLQLDFLRPLMRLGDRAGLATHLDEAERLATRAGDVAREGRVNAYRTFLALSQSTLAETRRFATRTRELGARAGDRSLVDVGDLFLGYEAVRAGDYRRARDILGGLVARMPAAADMDTYGAQTLPYVGARGRLGFALAQLGDFTAAVALEREAIAFAESVDHRYSVIWGWRDRVEVALVQGDPDAAAYAERALALVDAWEAFSTRPVFENALGWARVLEGRIDEGRRVLRTALAGADTYRAVVYRVDLLLRLGEAALLAGDIDEARGRADAALALARERGETGGELWALRLQGEVARCASPRGVTAAEDAYRRALALASERGMRPLVAHCHRGLGELSRATGRSAESGEHLKTAAAMFQDMAMRRWLGSPATSKAGRTRSRRGTSA
jgi:tetratricopeptide (TPR) repeat protein